MNHLLLWFRSHFLVRFFPSLLGFSAFLFTSVAVSAEVRFLIGPYADEGQAKSKAEQLEQLFKEKSESRVVVRAGRSYEEMVHLFVNKEVDIGFLTASTYVIAQEKVDLKVLLKKVWSQNVYYSTILAGQKLKSLQSLKGRRLAFVDLNSASGYLLPLAALQAAGVDLKKDLKSYKFSGHHQKSVQLLQQGQVDAIAVFANRPNGKDNAWDKYKSAVGVTRQPTPIWTSSAVPNDPMVVRSDFYDQNAKAVHDIMASLLDLFEDPKFKQKAKSTLEVEGMTVATSSQYQELRIKLAALKKPSEPAEQP